MGKLENATQWMINIANDSKHGYDQAYRWGERGDYDCSSLTITSDQLAGIPVKTNGATYTGNMYTAYIKSGYRDVTKSVNMATGAGLVRGDVLLNIKNHVARYIGNGQLVQASINELGKVTGGQSGDQKQLKGLKGEINISPYYNYPWDVVLRYNENGATVDTIARIVVTAKMPVLEYGMTGEAVALWQMCLKLLGRGISAVDASFGNETKKLTKEWELSVGITDSPDCVGAQAWKKALEQLRVQTSF